MTAASLGGAQAELTVDLDALKANWRLLADRVAPAECAAVVKADAYGVGIAQAVPALRRAGCRTFFVAHLSEGARARDALRAAFGPDEDSRIFLLHGLQPGGHIDPVMLSHRLGPVLGALHEIEAWIGATADRPDRPSCAIQVDTGMNRIGLPLEDVARLPAAMVGKVGAALLMSHLVAAEEVGNPLSAAQISAFADVRKAFPGLPASLANSSGIFLPQTAHFELVRPGYALYGGNPCPGQPNPMRPVVSLRAGILQTRLIAAGETVGYNGRWIAKRPSRLATIGIGYADGLQRNADTLGPNGPRGLVGGVPCPLVGRISMDLTVIDVTDAPKGAAEPGAPVELIGNATGIDDFARACGTIGYEILTSLGRRYGRRYLEVTG